MAADETMLEVVGRTPSTILRFYRWDRPTLSVGNSQRVAEAVDIEFCRDRGIGIVRRPTGGQAVLHDQELTYAVASSHPDLMAGPSPYAPYKRISTALAAGLATLGVPVELAPRMRRMTSHRTDPCFLEAGFSEVIYNGRKIAGSAQRRLRDRFLQHGSILIHFDPRLLAGCTRSDPASLASGVTSIGDVLEGAVPPLEPAFVRAFASSFGVQVIGSDWTPEEGGAIRELIRSKYGTDEWNFQR